MHKILFALVAVSISAAPALAQGEGAAAGAATGAIVGGVVGGPIGAAVGAGVGAGAGAAGQAAATPPNSSVTVESAPPTGVRERNTTCVQGGGTTTCTETEIRR